MNSIVLPEFKEYAYFSVRVDRFFHVLRIYGRHHDALKSAFKEMPSRQVTSDALNDERIDEGFRRFCGTTISALNYMSTTSIFSDGGDIPADQIPEDMRQFGFYTCYCFQWSLFENFIKDILRRAMDAHAIPASICQELDRRWYRTKQFFEFIESGRVFGHSPFVTMLPVPGWTPTAETIGYADLDVIRNLRNDFVHRAAATDVADSAMAQERVYDRSMWILRQFASNISQDTARLLETTAAQSPRTAPEES
jgi:hypothetical protein